MSVGDIIAAAVVLACLIAGVYLLASLFFGSALLALWVGAGRLDEFEASL